MAMLFLGIKLSYAQNDSTILLKETVVRGFESNRENLKTAAAISSLKIKEIERYDNTNFTQIFNSQPGVRIEERSPGSYRINIRGSSFRSPFGVRNVKIYWNAIPLTDASGNTYFNQVDINSIGSIEILRGPNGSIFGAGIGGVIDMKTLAGISKNRFYTDLSLGQFDTKNYGFGYTFGSSKNNTSIKYTDNQSDGYRNHSASARKSININSSFFIKPNHVFSVFAFVSNINYQTPGGLTLVQMNTDRKASRPKTPTIPAAADQKASIDQNLNFVGVSDEFQNKRNWKITSSLFYSKSILTNPAITSYERRNENSVGGRFLVTKKLAFINANFTIGTEAIKTNSGFDVFANLSGIKGDYRYHDQVLAKQASFFYQLDWQVIKDLFFTVGASHNYQSIDFVRIAKASTFKNATIVDQPVVPFSPRVSLLKAINNKFSIYGSLCQGFSAPTVAEFVNTVQNATNFKLLKAEKGINYELGSKYQNPNSGLYFEAAVYFLKLQNGLVRKLTEKEDEYFENSGVINQKGIELSSRYNIIKPNKNKFIADLNLQLNYVINDFQYKKYTNATLDFSGKALPGIAKDNKMVAFNINQKNGVFINCDINFLSKIPLNDANSEFSDPAKIGILRLGIKQEYPKFDYKVFIGADNIFNEKYSLGYDFNAAANRFYNPAPTRNLNAGIQLGIKF